MRWISSLAFSWVLFLAYASSSSAQPARWRCVPGGCSPVVPSAAAPAVTAPKTAKVKGPRIKVPKDAAEWKKIESQTPRENFGISSSPLTGPTNAVRVGPDAGPVASPKIEQAKPFEDDSRKPYIVVVGDEAFQADVKHKLAALGDAASFHQGFYAPGAWQASDVGYPAGVTICEPAGKDGGRVCHYQADALGLDKAIEAASVELLRRPRPAPDTKLLPDLRKKLLPGLDFSGWGRNILATFGACVYALGAFLILKL